MRTKITFAKPILALLGIIFLVAGLSVIVSAQQCIVPSAPTLLSGSINPCVGSTQIYCVERITYDDWFLPSKEELNKMYVNLKSGTDENGASYTAVGGLASGNYWSSSEAADSASTCAWTQNFSTGMQSGTYHKNQIAYVRAVRSFTSSTLYNLRYRGPAGGWIFLKLGTVPPYTYFECSAADQSSGAQWGCYGNDISSLDPLSGLTDYSVAGGIAVGTGYSNTWFIISREAGGCTTSGIAAKLCYDKSDVISGYTWSVPSGWLINTGQTTNLITVTVGSSSGKIIVRRSNDCGTNSDTSTLAVAPSSVNMPSSITGLTNPCPGSSQTYSVLNQPLVYDDWFLPSRDELKLMHDSLNLFGVGGFANDGYCSSSEQFGDPTAQYFYIVDMGNHISWFMDVMKDAFNPVRAVRAFSSTTNYQVRDIGPAGGWIFYKNGNNYMECASVDQSTDAAWGCINTSIPGSRDTVIGTGYQNTLNIIASCTSAGIAAKLCADYSVSGNIANTWSVPSGWTITSGQGTSSITVTVGATGGNISVTAASVCGSTTPTSTLAVTIGVATAQTITGTTPLAVGSTSTWTSTTAGGTWTSATPAVATVGSATGLVTGVTPGTSVITYSVTVGGCVNTATKTVTIIAGYTLSGKVNYLPQAYPGIIGASPTYGSSMYNIDSVIVILKNVSALEIARDTTDSQGVYMFSDVVNGAYTLNYDKYVRDTMEMVNNVNAVDIGLVKNFVGNPLDPSRSFSALYKICADVNNDGLFNAADIGAIKVKVGNPNDRTKNFKKGNWPAIVQSVTVSDNNILLDLLYGGYGDYNASSTGINNGTNFLFLWNQLKAMSEEGIINDINQQIIATSDRNFSLPLYISDNVKDLMAIGLELTYPVEDFRLISALVLRPGKKSINTEKINPSLEEVIAENGDLLVTDIDGVIRVVFATTSFFDLEANDAVLMFNFESREPMAEGELEFHLEGTGIVGDQFGYKQNVVMLKPQIFVPATTQIGELTSQSLELEFITHPNPFEQNTSIEYNLPEESQVSLKIFNILGEQVAELVNTHQATGHYSVNFDGKDLSTGLYSCRLEVSTLSCTKYAAVNIIKK